MQPPFDIAADLDTPVSAYLKLAPFRPRFLLESVEGGERLARYSFIGFGDALELVLEGDGVYVDGSKIAQPGDKDELLDALRAALAGSPRLEPALPGIPFTGGLVGAAGYDLVRRFETLAPAKSTGVPTAAWIAPASLLIFDHLTRRVALLHAGSETDRRHLRSEIMRALRGALPAPQAGMGFEPPRASFDRPAFTAAVRRCKEDIAAGDVYQLVLSVRFAGACATDPFEAYRALRLVNPSPYMYFLELGPHSIVGSSPEALVRLSQGQAMLRPIAGTRPRGADLAGDSRLEAELLADAKEAAEHVMLVDLARNDLGRVAEPGTVRVDPYRAVERYSHVMHLVSGVSGRLAPGRDAFDLFAAAFPAGTLVGAPKVRAMQLIDEYESLGRGFYAGSVGYFGAGGDMDQAIAIRTLVFDGGGYSYQAGAGIVADSVPANEHAEVLAKGAVLQRALELAEGGL
ncbi:MAG TPA: anthranilate synthase component I family protein [Gammaproteobacteria bacterium]|nr:anthranilate synthase component I family protein [Gammaproteobacteria bacterium]